jgi:GT2 family glycosyltransferase
MKVSIIIVNWNTRELLRQCLQSVYDETTVPFEVFVVDNASSDGSADMVRQNFPQVHLIANDQNRGFAAANNQAIPLARGEYILLLNPDTKVLDHAIDKMVNYMDGHPEVGACASKLLNGDGTLQKSVGNFYSFWRTLLENRLIPMLFPNSKVLSKKLVAFWDHSTVREIDWARGAVLMVRKSIVEKIGLLDEQFYIYGEEVDWCWRIKETGAKIVYIPDAVIIHYGKAASSQRHVEMFIQNYKSFYIFLKKHYPWYTYWIYRIRTTIYHFFWIARFALIKLIKDKDSPQYQDAVKGMKAYWASLKWHFSSKSKISVVKT